MTKKYLCFLDVDGVLTSNRVHATYGGNYGIWSKFDPVAVDFFNWMHDTYDLSWVLMSTWKDHLSSEDKNISHWVRSAFANAGFRGNLNDLWKTDPDNLAKMKNWDRAHEVKDYLNNFGSDFSDFIMFDDNRYRFDDVLGVKRLVRTSSEDGLLYKHMLNAKSIMGQWEKRK
jgi:hypothetical protein